MDIVPGNAEAVWTQDSSILLERITATGSGGAAIYLAGGSGDTIRDSVFTGNVTAIAFVQGGQNSLVENCTITGNNVGIELDNSGQDLGGGALGSVGHNVISCNTTNDVWTNQFPTIVAHDDYWDHVPPDTVTDFYNSGLTTVLDSANAILAPSPCP
jgi:parallel beta-helix repeat protein